MSSYGDDDALVPKGIRALTRPGVTLMPAPTSAQPQPAASSAPTPSVASSQAALQHPVQPQPAAPTTSQDDVLVPAGVHVLTRPGVTYYYVTPSGVSTTPSGGPLQSPPAAPPTSTPLSPPTGPMNPAQPGDSGGLRSPQLHGPGDGPAMGPRQAASAPPLRTSADREEFAFSYLRRELGLSSIQAAALVANLSYESTAFTRPGSPRLVAGLGEVAGGGGIGLAQWTTAGRKAKLFAFARARGKPWTDFQVELDFVVHELRGDFAYALADLKRASSLYDATSVVENYYEYPLDPKSSIQARYTYAQRVLGESR